MTPEREALVKQLVVAAEVMRCDLAERIEDGARLNPGTMYAFNALSKALAALTAQGSATTNTERQVPVSARAGESTITSSPDLSVPEQGSAAEGEKK